MTPQPSHAVIGLLVILLVLAAIVAVVWLLTRRRRAPHPLPRGLRRAARRQGREAVPTTGRELTGRVEEIVDGQALVAVQGGAILAMPAAKRWVGEVVTVYEYADETWHAGPHPSWPTEEEQA